MDELKLYASVNEFAPLLQSLVPPYGNQSVTTRFTLQLSGLDGMSSASVGVHVKTLFQNFFGNRFIATYQYRVGNEHVFFVTVNKWDDPQGLRSWGRAFNN